MEVAPGNSDIKKNLQEETEKTDSASAMPTNERPHNGAGNQIIMTENMIRLNRRWNYASRPRPMALAIVHPETGAVLYPGREKIEVQEKKLQPLLSDAETIEVDQVPGNRYRRMNPYRAEFYANYYQPLTYHNMPYIHDFLDDFHPFI